MFCPSCGIELPDTAKFCVECGKPSGAGNAEPQYESCEVCWEVTDSHFWSHDEMRYWARSVGPGGERVVAQGQTFQGLAPHEFLSVPIKANEPRSRAHKEFLAQLASDGWEHTGRGGSWWNDRFKRPVG